VAPDIFRLFAAMGVMLRNVYGCSEFGLITVHQGAQVNPETIGQLVLLASPWARAHAVAAGRGWWPGGLRWRGFAGYWGKPDKSAEKMNGDWFQTGDAVGQGPTETELIYYDRVEHMSSLQGGPPFLSSSSRCGLRFSPYIRECHGGRQPVTRARDGAGQHRRRCLWPLG
jgi:long-chain acyl-CoA synthetase